MNTGTQAEKFHFHDVVSFTPIKDYVLRVRFDDGAERVIDFEPILFGPLFSPLRDPQIFRRVRIDADLGTLVWPTGADIDPGVLYDWPWHVDTIIQRRRQQWETEYPEKSGREQSGYTLQRVAEANSEIYDVSQLAEEPK